MMKNKEVKKTANVININEVESFRFIESFKALRTNIMFSLSAKEDVNCRKIVFTSANAGEGKSTVAVNLSISLSETETKVMLIDADMRKPTVNKYFGMESRIGLANLLTGMNTLEECIQKVEDNKNLSVITAGVMPPNPAELLGSSAMDKVFCELEKHYDYIIIDTPPVNEVSDVLSIANKVDGVVFVACNGKTTYPEASNAIKALRFANAKIIGSVINKAQRGNKKYHYGSYANNSYKIRYKTIVSSSKTGGGSHKNR